jgi:hypothetical protein
MKTEDFKDLIRPIVYKYGSGWLLDKPEMLEEICKKYHSEQLLIHSVVKSFPCGDEIWLKAQETDRFLFEEWYNELK